MTRVELAPIVAGFISKDSARRTLCGHCALIHND
jgi:hypothetical protein